MSWQEYVDFYWGGGPELEADEKFAWDDMGDCSDCEHRALVWADDKAETKFCAYCQKCRWSLKSPAPRAMAIVAAKLHHKTMHEKEVTA